jgi:ubiquitin carboxyl-terminal hydrolase 4/11/15
LLLVRFYQHYCLFLSNAKIGAIDLTLKDEAGKAFVPLKKGLIMDTDIFLLPEAAWNQVIKWYGLTPGQQPITRYQHSVTQSESDFTLEYQFELYPPTFVLRKLVSDKANTGADKLSPAPRILAGTSQKYVEFLKVVKRQLGISVQTKIKVARVVELQVASDAVSSSNIVGPPSPPASRENSPTRPQPVRKLLDTSTYKTLDESGQIDLLDRKDETMNEKYNGSSTLEMLGLRVDQTLVICEESSKNRLDVPKKLGAKGTIAKDAESAPSSGRASPAGIMTRGRYRAQNGRAKGSVGLTNLGNTCYMNSALQCMRACQELSTFFISKLYSESMFLSIILLICNRQFFQART